MEEDVKIWLYSPKWGNAVPFGSGDRQERMAQKWSETDPNDILFFYTEEMYRSWADDSLKKQGS